MGRLRSYRSRPAVEQSAVSLLTCKLLPERPEIVPHFNSLPFIHREQLHSVRPVGVRPTTNVPCHAKCSVQISRRG